MTPRDHGDLGDAPSTPPPLQRPAATIAASTNAATLATLTVDGDPWASFVADGLLNGCVSNLAEYGRNLAGDPRASLSIVAANADTDTAVCTAIDRYGSDIRVDNLRGIAYTSVGFLERLDNPGQLRSEIADLARAAAVVGPGAGRSI
ncbi:pyridoxamine 5'-phosphate oxidase family protein [Mycobacterium sp.]|uniref:pyridoxamine 5'-phosphate oxidase family protein n=1 Tax=Mycobacterium sp. TaxID=1785 RepID=UPI0031DF93B2